MRTILLCAALVATTILSAQNVTQNMTANSVNSYVEETVPTSEITKGIWKDNGFRTVSGVTIGTAGNLYTVLTSETNCLTVDPTTNGVAFIHRNDPSVNTGTVSEYRFDYSLNNGDTWTIDKGVLNPTSAGQVEARYPQVSMYINPNNPSPDSNYIVYFGSYHDDTTWEGGMTGVSSLNGKATSYTENIYNGLGGDVGIFTGLCQSVPGTFWTVSDVHSFTFQDATNSLPLVSHGLVIAKGVWNNNTKDVDWTFDSMTVKFDNSFDGNSKMTSLNMEFDPSGQVGWIFALADINLNSDSLFSPVYSFTVDGGNTWSKLQMVDLSNFPSLMNTLSPQGSGLPGPGFDAELTVDKKGQPHFAFVAGSGTDYAIQSALPLNLFDLTIDSATFLPSLNLINEVHTFRAENIIGDVTQDNRVIMSRSQDGEFVFFQWLDSDTLVTGGTTNTAPNLFGKALRVSDNKMSETFSWTANDPTFGQLVMFPAIAPIAITKNANHYSVPTTVVIPTGNDDQPVGFTYLKDIDYRKPMARFTKTPAGGASMTATFTNTTEFGPETYAWDFGDASGTSTLENPSYTYSTPGAYKITLIATNMFGVDTFTMHHDAFPLGVNLVDANKATVYPNPTEGQLVVELAQDAGNYTVDIYNITGVLVASNNYNTKKANINMTDLAPGTYILKFSGDNVTGSQRVIKR